MKIPTRFKLMGQTIEVIYDPTLINENDWTGLASYRTNEIRIQPDTQCHPRKPDKIGHTFVHELVHHILYYAGASRHEECPDKLHTDEGFVDTFAGLLHQALSTAEYFEDKNSEINI